MADRADRLQRRIERERKRREEAERIAEQSTRELYERQRELKELADSLEQRVEERTQELERRLAQQKAIADLTGKALEGVEPGTLIDELCTRTSNLLDTDYCEVFELTDDQDQLVLRAGVGWPPEYIDEKAVDASPDCQTGYTLQHREPTVVHDIHQENRFRGPDLLNEAQLRSGITVVVPGPREPWGVFGVHSKQPRAYDENDAAFVESMGHVLSQTIHRSRSRTELKDYADRLERANWELENFAHLVSHDLREPIRMVKNYMELIEERYGDELDEQAREMITHAKTGAERGHQMIRGLLRYARLDASDLDTQPVDGDKVLDEVLRTLDPQIEASNAHIERDPLPTVEAEPAQLSQIFQNLLKNAIKYTPSGEEPHVSIRAQPHDGAWRFSIEDNGVGMDPADTDEIFQMFSQGSSEGGGHGIGLAITQKIVRRHGGRIWVDTEPGEGSTFHFTLPRA